MKRSTFATVLPPIITFVMLLVIWETVVWWREVPLYLLPSPKAIAMAMADNAGSLAKATMMTTIAAAGGFALSAVVGVLIAIILSSARVIERSFYPFTVFLQTVPLVAIAPLLVVWIGYGIKPVIVSAFIVSLFPIIANTLAGLRSVDPALRDLFRLYGASRWARLVKLNLPWALPNIFTGFRVSAGLAVIGAIVGEFMASYANTNGGLGIIVVSCLRESRTDLVFAAVVLASLMGLALFLSVNLAGYLVLRRWHASARD